MTRLVSGIVLALAAVAAIVWLPLVVLRVLAAVVAGAAALEFTAAAGVTRDISRALVVVMAAVACWWLGMPAFVSAAAATALALAWLALEVLLFGHDIGRAASAVAGAIYVGGPLGLLVAIHARSGWRVTLLLLATVVVSGVLFSTLLTAFVLPGVLQAFLRGYDPAENTEPISIPPPPSRRVEPVADT